MNNEINNDINNLVLYDIEVDMLLRRENNIQFPDDFSSKISDTKS